VDRPETFVSDRINCGALARHFRHLLDTSFVSDRIDCGACAFSPAMFEERGGVQLLCVYLFSHISPYLAISPHISPYLPHI